MSGHASRSLRQCSTTEKSTERATCPRTPTLSQPRPLPVTSTFLTAQSTLIRLNRATTSVGPTSPCAASPKRAMVFLGIPPVRKRDTSCPPQKTRQCVIGTFSSTPSRTPSWSPWRPTRPTQLSSKTSLGITADPKSLLLVAMIADSSCACLQPLVSMPPAHELSADGTLATSQPNQPPTSKLTH